jgi:hypothetical protein
MKRMRGRWGSRQLISLLEVNSIEGVLCSHGKDSCGEHGKVLRTADRGGEVGGTGPSTDGNAGHCVMLLSQLDKLRNERGSGCIETENGGVCSGYAKK